MGIWTGDLTARRYRVVGELPPGWRERYRDQLEAMAFREPAGKQGKEELEGWVQVHNLLDTSFASFDRWLYDRYAIFALRVDKKALPAKLLKATVEKRCEAWCEEKGVERCPASVRKELRERLEEEWLSRVLPRVQTTEVCWHVVDGWVLVGSLSEGVNDRVRKRFHRTFGLELHPWSPLDWVADADARDGLLASSPAAVGSALGGAA